MTEAELHREVVKIVRQELAPILMANITATQDVYRASAQRSLNETPIDNMRLIQPYGFASRPPKGTQALMVPVASDPTHINVVGQFDQNRPPVNDGESCLYGPDGAIVYMQTGKNIRIGSLTSASPLVLGDILKTFTDGFIDAVVSALTDIVTGPVAVTTTPGNPAPTHPTLIAALNTVITNLNTLKSQYVDTASTNFLSQKNFTERGT